MEIKFYCRRLFFSISLESKNNEKFIYYNLSEKLELKTLDILEKRNTFYTI